VSVQHLARLDGTELHLRPAEAGGAKRMPEIEVSAHRAMRSATPVISSGSRISAAWRRLIILRTAEDPRQLG
jgi:hypothetical protein